MKLRPSMIYRKKAKCQTEDKIKEWENRLNQQRNNSKYNYFGKPLKNICRDNVPIFVIKCIAFIEQTALDIEGLYRKSGSKQDIETLKMSFEADHNIDFSNLGFNTHIFTGALKSFFTLLPESFIPEDSLPDIVESTGESDPNVRITKLKTSISKLSPEVRETLKCLVRHFYNVCSQKDKNKMDARNLAICFWPSLIKSTPSNNIKTIQQGDNMLYCLFIHTLIENFFEIFDEVNPSSIETNDSQQYESAQNETYSQSEPVVSL
ncbi:Rho GTPase-activating protein 5 [Thelohanellus kitauei]|uniref:Rho GTPase-activating protein 5 n=1 Tax=Thelohanellus kitauei TaxID=669202 RepID=A0A0C2MP13_THEKT|nr:Rho GTPase-activating protein 5 [Thelohanellus kitauei]